MAYFDKVEHGKRIEKVQKLIAEKNLDFAFIYYDELNLANAWYLSAWCPQFESGAVFVPRDGEPMILGGPESEPFAIQDSAIKNTRNLPVFMVPDEEYPNATIITFAELFKEISADKKVSRIGLVGMDYMPLAVYNQLVENFKGIELVDITDDYLKFRYIKSPWEIEQIKAATNLAYGSYLEMKKMIKPGNMEYQVAAAGEAYARMNGANDFAFRCIVGSGLRSNAVVPTSSDKVMNAGEMVMVGLAPRVKGYAGVMGDTLPVSGEYTPAQLECIKHLRETYRITREAIKPGRSAKEVYDLGKAYFDKIGYSKYLVCPFTHTIGINEAEAPFFGPGSKDIFLPGMTVCVDVSFFGHPEFNGTRIETAFVVTETGIEPLCPEMDKIHLS